IAILEPLLADRERALGSDHANTLRTRNNLAIVYQDAGRTDDAIAILEPLVGDLERTLGAEHPDAVGARNNLARAYDAAGRRADADSLRGTVGGWDDDPTPPAQGPALFDVD
ncbi:MAG: hypothetical protein QOJ89_1539, partial [bacterium]